MNHERYAEWDAAYVLGALSPAERREFEEHLAHCELCARELAELAALPGLLGALPATDAVAQLDGDARAAAAGDPAAPELVEPAAAGSAVVGSAAVGLERPPADLLPRLVRHMARRRRVRSWTLGGVVALAAAAVVVALVLPLTLGSFGGESPAPTVSLSLQQQEATPITATVALTSVPWGTKVAMTCTYREVASDAYASAGRFALYAVDTSGKDAQVSSWSASPGDTVHASGSLATPIPQLARVELRDATGQVLLSAPVR